MAHHVETTVKVRANAKKVWQTLDDFSSIERFSATVKSSPIVGNRVTGLGAKRKCTFIDKSTVMEEIVSYNDGKGIRIELSEYSMPLASMFAEMNVEAIDESNCSVTFGMDYVVKFGPLGWLMGSLLMRPMMKGVTKKVMQGLAFHVVTGKNIDSQQPSARELKEVLG